MKLSVKSLLFDYGGTIDTNGVHWGEALWDIYCLYDNGLSRDIFSDVYVKIEQKLGSQSLILPNHTFRETLEIKVRLQLEELRVLRNQVTTIKSGLQKQTNLNLLKQVTETCYENTHRCIRSASEVLDQLKECYPMYLVSNFYGNLREVLHEFNLTHYFQAVIESAEVGFRKPDPEIFRLAIEKTGCKPEEIVIIGDSYKNDIQPANQLGCRSIWLKVKGWNNEAEPVEHPLTIDDFSKLRTILL